MQSFYLRVTGANRAVLESEEARHCIKVLRKKPGETIIGVDGNGNRYVGRIEALGKDKVELRLESTEEGFGEHPYHIHLYFSPLRVQDRLEWFIEKAVELGVTDLHPVLMKHTVKKGFRHNRVEKIMIAALKQCLRSRLPVLNKLEQFSEIDIGQDQFTLYANVEQEKNPEDYRQEIIASSDIALWIGPEGDFSKEELKALQEKGSIGVNLGVNRLRAETAAIHLLSVVKQMKGY